jgi:hypothetical protein
MMDEKDVGDLMLNNGKNTSSVSKLPKNGRQDVGVTKDDDFFCSFIMEVPLNVEHVNDFSNLSSRRRRSHGLPYSNNPFPILIENEVCLYN